MKAETPLLDGSLIAVRYAGVARIAPAPLTSEVGEAEFEPRMCANNSSLTGSGGDFAFSEPGNGVTSL